MSDIHFAYKTLPRAHQVEAFYKLYGKEYFALLMEQGTGKSKVAIDIASNLFLENKIDAVLLIAPNNVHTQWHDEQIPEHSPIPYTTFLWERKNSATYQRELSRFIRGKAEGSLKWFCVNVETFSTRGHLDTIKDYVKRHKTMIIVDEATKIKNPDANRTQNIIQGLSDITREGRRILAIQPLSKYRAILTGTIVTNAPFNVWSPFEFLNCNYFGLDYFSFKARYGIEVTVRLPGRTRDFRRKIKLEEIRSVRKYIAQGKDAEAIARLMKISESSAQFLINNPSVNAPYKNLDDLKRKIEPVSFTVLKKDCLDLPPKIYMRVYATMTDEQKRAYEDVRKTYEAQFKDLTLSAVNKVTAIGRLQQITGGFFPGKEIDEMTGLVIDSRLEPFSSSPKLEALIDDLEECSDRPVIIVAHFTAEIRAIYERLQKEYEDETVEMIYGNVQPQKRNDIREAFNRREVSFLVANAATIGMGFNLQVCHTMYFYSNGYSFDERAQVEDRIHRDGQKAEAVLYKDIVVKGTVDERVLEVLHLKKDLLDYMRDDITTGQFLGMKEEANESR